MHVEECDIPERLGERTRCVGSCDVNAQGTFVLYWLHHAMRADENPALDVAVHLANRLELPLIVYQGLPESLPFASDRHHRFVLEGVLDLQQRFDERGIAYAFHLDREGHRGPHLKSLATQAAVVVTDEMPVQPLKQWIEELAASSMLAWLAVDASCVAPMKLVGKAYDRAFEYRRATQSLYDKRARLDWDVVELSQRTGEGELRALPFEPLRFSEADMPSLLAACEIDHSVGTVPHTRGGSKAGDQRWNAFRDTSLARYAKLRNDPLTAGTSRMSAYLHYGMVSPFRIAREVTMSPSDGGEKFLDELLIWRESAYAFCFYRDDIDSLAAIPPWARTSLAEHQQDARSRNLSWETLARGQSGDVLWDAAQRSLLVHGELHNNVRMTWGKMLLHWTPDADSALQTLLDLNHRYALDGSDPASYGGILWCLGQFDRPFRPKQPILGCVRGRTSADHAKRLDVARFSEHTDRSLDRSKQRVAVVGAGLSGLMCARTLMDHGIDVIVFEKSRGAGGRMATRRAPEGLRFDHGAQYFTARDRRFQRYVTSWLQDGFVERWDGRIVSLEGGQVEEKHHAVERFVGVPGMNAICRHLAKDVNVLLETRVARVTRADDSWQLTTVDEEIHPGFDGVVISAPAPQAADLLGPAPLLRDQAKALTMGGCWALMVAFAEPLDLPFDGAFVQESPLSWVARNTSKPERGIQETWVLHASAEWTISHIDVESESVQTQLLAAFFAATGMDPLPPAYAAVHKWRYAIPSGGTRSDADMQGTGLAEGCLWDEQLRIGACGDWCHGARVEGAFLSGMAISGRVMSSLQ